MNKRKIAVVFAIGIVAALSLASCGKPYSDVDLKEYIKVGDYKGLEVLSYKVSGGQNRR